MPSDPGLRARPINQLSDGSIQPAVLSAIGLNELTRIAVGSNFPDMEFEPIPGGYLEKARKRQRPEGRHCGLPVSHR